MRRVMVLAVLLLAFPVSGLPADIYVPDDHPSIQAAIDSAATGDRIFVRSGTYVENIDFLGKEIVVESESGPQTTVIDGNGAGSVVIFQSGETDQSVLRGFTIMNGSALSGGGIHCVNSSPTVAENIIEGNAAINFLGGLGGGIYLESSSASITDNTITLNTSSSSLNLLWESQGGGIHCCSGSSPLISGNDISGNTSELGGGICCDGSAVVIDDNTLWGNTADYGGGIHAADCSPTITNNTISGNTAGYDGGGGICCTNQSDPLISGNSITDNVSSYFGGGVLCSYQSEPVISDNVISDNEASSGGGIHCYYDSFATIAGNTISGNTAAFHGAGIRCDRACAAISGNRITGNGAGWGGGISCYTLSTIFLETTISANVITDNSASNDGGGILCSYHCHQTTNNVIAGNTAGNDGAGFCHGLSNDPSTFTNNTLFGNTAVSRGGGLFCEEATLTIMNSILWNNSAPTGSELFDASGGGAAMFCNVENGTGEPWFGPGCIDSDPLFVDSGAGDFHLTSDSPCWNAGHNQAAGLPTVDFEGDPRTAYLRVDMGADEFHTHLYYTGSPVTGETIEIKIVGIPGASPVTMVLGSGIQDPPKPVPPGFLYLLPPFRPLDQPPIPSNGVAVIPVYMGAFWQSGKTYPFQALVGNTLTNLMTITVE